jgi:hypothetical protein
MTDWQPVHTLSDVVGSVLPPIPVSPIQNNQAAPQISTELKSSQLTFSPKCPKETITGSPKDTDQPQRASNTIKRISNVVLEIFVLAFYSIVSLFFLFVAYTRLIPFSIGFAIFGMIGGYGVVTRLCKLVHSFRTGSYGSIPAK